MKFIVDIGTIDSTGCVGKLSPYPEECDTVQEVANAITNPLATASVGEAFDVTIEVVE